MAEPQDSIHIATFTAAVVARRTLCRAIFGTPHVPHELPTAATVTSPIAGLPDATKLSLPGVSDAHLWVPAAFDGTVVVVHQGHVASLNQIGVNTLIVELFNAGHAVVGCLMPSAGSVPAHDAGTIPLADFLRPVFGAVRYAFENLDVRKLCMTGLSGGGWTTAMCAALDWRIMRSIPTAGSTPLYAPNPRDWEQYLPGCAPYTYLDLYILAGQYARRSRQIMHSADGVHDWASMTGKPDYLAAVQAVASGFDRTIVTETQHVYSVVDRAIVHAEIAA